MGNIGLAARLSRYFPDHEIYVRSGGQMRFLRITTALQLKLIAVAALLLAGWLALTALTFGAQLQTMRDRATLGAEKQELSKSAIRVEAYRESVDGLAARIEKRQRAIDAMVTRYFGDLRLPVPAQPATLGAAIPEAAPLARIEQRQLAFAETLTMAAAMRASEAERAIRAFGLNPKTFTGGAAMGGPYIPARVRASDPRFTRLAQSLKRLDTLERSLAAIPNAAPTAPMALSSGFGFRADPFVGGTALHAGVDVTGLRGQPILAAASGRVVHVGPSNGYGKLVTIDHGNGLETRYGHLSGYKVKLGDRVTRGQPVAAMGNTGRSTGTHLHFEVRVHGRAIDPRPFLGGKKDVLEVQNSVERRFAAGG